jgi:hypothetical protein
MKKTAKNIAVKKSDVIKSITKLMNNKDTVLSYMKGEISFDKLNKKGIKLAKPL